MEFPTTSQLNDIRKKGFRPGVVSCIVHNKMLLLFYKREYGEWQLPQGGIENGESIEDAVNREMLGELGANLTASFLKPYELIGEDELVFPKQHHGVKELKTDEGEDILMQGKKYYFCVINVPTEDVAITETEFDDYFWLPFDQALYLANQSKAVNKKKLVVKVITLLKELGFIN